ncbi:class I SAM-dependent methyltransferase [Microbacterium sp. No. 7]|uniref:class I SAM-dependent methyltransferase n=1 Tax=Microbacterium sp. No. 7 TaxID=1714373 RepID=UPI0006D09C3D|nr:class I SAM-dependent methyltransferase [Microbacterium sp. No. 7]ALJ20127.1 SAM-dependent methyltransferase [Microbacterium sp. No. 7]
MSLKSVRASYGARAGEYIDAVGRIEHVAGPDLALIEEWASGIDGRVLDVGCGPGQWTDHLTRRGVDVEGIDPVPEFIEHARAAYPGARYRLGLAEDLGVENGSLGGVLAWYSLIHTDPELVSAPLDEFARSLGPGGGLAIGFFAGPRPEPFDHAVTTAYSWPIELLAASVEAAGFVVTRTEGRTDPGARPHGALLAVRSPSASRTAAVRNSASRARGAR